MNDHDKGGEHRCFIGDCPNTPTHCAERHVGQWLLRVNLCAEHYRELEKGTPLSGLPVDTCRIEAEATSMSPTEQHFGLLSVSPQ